MMTSTLKNTALVLGLTLSTLSPGFAAIGGDSGGGGDALEVRVNEIRSDLLEWIKKGGARELTLPTDISYGEYEDKMKDILENKKVALSFTNDVVKVNGAEKTCRGSFLTVKTFSSEKKTSPQVLCNITRFKNTAESEQYPLIHHEYAALQNLERNDGAASDYEISNQITDFLENKIVKKLAVKKKPEPKVERDLTLRGVNVKSAYTFNKAETLAECRPFHEKLEAEQLAQMEFKTMQIYEQAIVMFYVDNKIGPIESIKLLSKKKLRDEARKKTDNILIFSVTAGEDTAEIRLAHTIDGEYKRLYRESVTQYVDKLGRVKSTELNCGVSMFYEIGHEPNHFVSMTNNSSGHSLEPSVITKYDLTLAFLSKAKIVKQL